MTKSFDRNTYAQAFMKGAKEYAQGAEADAKASGVAHPAQLASVAATASGATDSVCAVYEKEKSYIPFALKMIKWAFPGVAALLRGAVAGVEAFCADKG